MWIVSNKGFLSVVAKGRDGTPSGAGPDAVVSVRFRRRRDAVALFPQHEVVATPGGDYGFRVFATRREVADVLAQEVLGINYTNFKDSIPVADKALLHAAHRAWDVFGDLQEGGPYGRDVPRLPDWWEEVLSPKGGRKARKAKGGKAARRAA